MVSKQGKLPPKCRPIAKIKLLLPFRVVFSVLRCPLPLFCITTTRTRRPWLSSGGKRMLLSWQSLLRFPGGSWCLKKRASILSFQSSLSSATRRRCRSLGICSTPSLPKPTNPTRPRRRRSMSPTESILPLASQYCQFDLPESWLIHRHIIDYIVHVIRVTLLTK